MQVMKHIIAFFLFAAISISNSNAQANLYKLHSLFIYNFTKHIQWQQTSGNFTIGVYGSDIAFDVIKENLGTKRVWSNTINVIKVNSGTEAANCQLIYAPKSNRNKIISLIESVNLTNKLFVTEDDLIEFGAQICFFLKGNRLNFKISENRCKQNGLKVSSALLSLGTSVD